MTSPPSTRRVSEAMQRVFASVRPDEHMDLVQDVMSLGQIRHLPVLDDGVLAGVVSQRDLLAAGLSSALAFGGGERRRFLGSVPVSEVMTAEVVTIAEQDTLDEAARRMLEHRIGCLPVVDEARHVRGLLSESDLVRAAYT